MDGSTRLFVYGTLKRGQSHHHLLSGQHCLGIAITLPEYQLLDLGWYPGLAAVRGTSKPGRTIRGELWEVSAGCLEALDQYEGPEYQRTVLSVQLNGENARIRAETYVLKNPPWERCRDAGEEWV